MVRALSILTLGCGFCLLSTPAQSQDRTGFGYVCSVSYSPSYPNSIWGDFGTVGVVIRAAPHCNGENLATGFLLSKNSPHGNNFYRYSESNLMELSSSLHKAAKDGTLVQWTCNLSSPLPTGNNYCNWIQFYGHAPHSGD